MKEKLIRFMYGRYGMDSLGKFTIITGVVSMVLAGWNHSMILSLILVLHHLYLFPHVFTEYLQALFGEPMVSEQNI